MYLIDFRHNILVNTNRIVQVYKVLRLNILSTTILMRLVFTIY